MIIHTVHQQKLTWNKNMLVWKMFLSNEVKCSCSMFFSGIPYGMFCVIFNWALYHYLVNRRCCPTPKDLIKLQDSCDVRPRRVWSKEFC